MEEAPHAHENLFAKSKRHSHDADSRSSYSSSISSEASFEEQDAVVPAVRVETNPDPSPDAAAQICAQPRTFLLEPLILMLLFAYNFSCKSRMPYKLDLSKYRLYFSYYTEISDHLSELHGGLWLLGDDLQPAGHTECHE